MPNEWSCEWIYEATLSNYEMYLFNFATHTLKNYNYQPIAVAKLAENAGKFRFLCIARPKFSHNSQSHFACIEVYKPINGFPYATKVHKLDTNIFN